MTSFHNFKIDSSSAHFSFCFKDVGGIYIIPNCFSTNYLKQKGCTEVAVIS